MEILVVLSFSSILLEEKPTLSSRRERRRHWRDSNNKCGDSVLFLSSILLEEKPILSSRKERRKISRSTLFYCWITGMETVFFLFRRFSSKKNQSSPREEKEEGVEEIRITGVETMFSFVDSPREEKEENVKEIWITGVETVFFLYRRFSSKKNSPIPLSSPSTNRGLTNSSPPQLMSRGGEEECTLDVQWQSDRSSSRWTDIPTEYLRIPRIFGERTVVAIL